MALFEFRWLRNFVRRHTKPIPEVRAATWKSRLSILYAVLAWNAFGVVCYAIASGKADWAKYHGLVSEEDAHLRPAQHYAKTLGIKNATVYRVSGLDVSSYKIENQEEQEAQNQGAHGERKTEEH